MEVSNIKSRLNGNMLWFLVRTFYQLAEDLRFNSLSMQLTLVGCQIEIDEWIMVKFHPSGDEGIDSEEFLGPLFQLFINIFCMMIRISSSHKEAGGQQDELMQMLSQAFTSTY